MVKNMTSIKTKELVGYCRVKTGEPYEETVENQKTIISQYAEEYGYTITDWYSDKVWFGRPAVRPEYRQMMKDVVNGKVHGVITAQIDRFSDNVCDFADSAKIMAAHNCTFVSVADKIDDSPEGKLMTAIMLNMADYYARQRAAAGAPAER